MPLCNVFSGVFNCHSQHWWSAGDANANGTEVDELMSSLERSQLISEPTNFEPHKNPSCIDLIFSDQPNIGMESDNRASLDIVCHHQIIYCRINLKPTVNDRLSPHSRISPPPLSNKPSPLKLILTNKPTSSNFQGKRLFSVYGQKEPLY